jgi:threonine dehydrogenase-like Zn-dependent dehydrogenase
MLAVIFENWHRFLPFLMGFNHKIRSIKGVGKGAPLKAIWLENNILTYRDHLPKPNPSQNEALVKVRLAGICGTDLELTKGYYQFTGIPGHEFVGDIVQAPGRPDREGERVVGEINVNCGACPACLAGRPKHCENRSVLGIKHRHGAFAEFMCLPLANLIAVPDTVCDDAAVFTEPLAAALEIQEQVAIEPNNHVLVLGAGRLGQLIAQTLVSTGCDLKVVARYANQRKLLARFNIASIAEHTPPAGFFDIVIESTGSMAGFSLARKAVRPGGIIVLKSTYRGDVRVNFSTIVVDEVTIIGSRCGPFDPALGLLANNRVDPTGLIEGRYSLNAIQKAFQHAGRPGALKVILQISER